MSSYKNVLVAVDGSDESMIILQRAADMVTAEGATINVVQVFETLLASYSFELNMGDFEILQQRHQELLAQRTGELVAQYLPSRTAEVHFLRGRPADEIKRLAEDLNIDLLIIGSHGHSPVRAVLGSTANSVLHGIHCDVLTVRV